MEFLLELLLQVDTTSTQYQIGRKIGEYIPITLLMIAALFYISRAYRLKDKNNPD